MKVKALHIAGEKLHRDAWNRKFMEELEGLLALTIVEGGNKLPVEERLSLIREHEILLTNWKCPVVPDELAEEPGRLRYICNISGSVKKYLSRTIIDSRIIVSNWGDAPAFRVAEGVVVLLLALVKDIPRRAERIRGGDWFDDDSLFSVSLRGLNIGFYGLGFTGRKTVALLQPFEPVMRVFDPYVDSLPEGCIAVNSKEELFSSSQAVSIHAGLSEETRGSIGAEELARLPDGGILVNTARGAILDQKALFTELKSGRLKAGLDVLEPDELPRGHEARHWPNVIFTAHEIARVDKWPGLPDELGRHHKNCLDNLKNYMAGREIRFQLNRNCYERST